MKGSFSETEQESSIYPLCLLNTTELNTLIKGPDPHSLHVLYKISVPPYVNKYI